MISSIVVGAMRLINTMLMIITYSEADLVPASCCGAARWSCWISFHINDSSTEIRTDGTVIRTHTRMPLECILCSQLPTFYKLIIQTADNTSANSDATGQLSTDHLPPPDNICDLMYNYGLHPPCQHNLLKHNRHNKTINTIELDKYCSSK